MNKSISIDEVSDILKKVDNVQIISHRSPDCDTLGSSISLYHALKNMGKNAQIICSDPFPVRYEYMYGEREFEKELEKVDYIIAVDLATEDLLGDNLKEKYSSKIDLTIDHHSSDTFYAKQTYLNLQSSNCENMYDIYENMGIEITKEMATALLSGILTDTGRFLHAVDSKTFRIVANLLDTGIDGKEITHILFGAKSKNRIAAEKEVYKNLEFACDGKVAISYLTHEFFENVEIDNADLDNIANLPIEIEGVDVGIIIREREENTLRTSLRSKNGVSANNIAKNFGGGGHLYASGCTIDGDVKNGVKKLIDASVKEILGN